MFAIFRKPITIKRRAPGSYVNGFFVQGAESTLTINASVQPAGERDVQLLPEGRRDAGAFRLFTDSVLQVAQEGTGKNNDVALLAGAEYEIMAEMPWQNSIIPHRVYVAARVTESSA
jgi:hypothetical protein